MKTRKLLIAMLIVALLAVYYVLGTDYLRQRREHGTAAARITATAQELARLPPRPADLDPRLAAARADLAAAQDAFPDHPNSTRIVDAILKLAEVMGVKAIPLVTQPWAADSFNGQGYAVFRLNVTVRGTFTQLSGFISQLETGELKTLVIEYASVDRVAGPAGEEIPVNAKLELAVFARPPSPG